MSIALSCDIMLKDEKHSYNALVSWVDVSQGSD